MRTVVASIGALFVSLGCSGAPDDRPAVFPVTGIITYKGKPVAGALVTFSSANSPRSASSMTNTYGEYSLSTFNSDDGAVVGEHQVIVTKSASSASSSDPTTGTIPDISKGLPGGYPTADKKTGKMMLPSAPQSELPARYSDGKTAALKATVKATGKNEINYDLED